MPATMGSYLASGAIYFGLEKKLFTFSNELKGKKEEFSRAKKGKENCGNPTTVFCTTV